MAIDQLVDEYIQRGYEVKVLYPLSKNLRVDLFAVKGEDKIAIKFVSIDTPADMYLRLNQVASEDNILINFIEISNLKLEQRDNDNARAYKTK